MYTILFSTQALRVYIKLDSNLRKQIDQKMLSIVNDPYEKNNNIKSINGKKHCYRLRVGDWHVVYEIVQNQLKIIVINIGQRKEVYR